MKIHKWLLKYDYANYNELEEKTEELFAPTLLDAQHIILTRYGHMPPNNQFSHNDWVYFRDARYLGEFVVTEAHLERFQS